MAVPRWKGKALRNLLQSDTVLWDGVEADAAEVNVLDGATGLETEDLVKLAEITASSDEINLLDGAGAAVASGTPVANITDAKVDYDTGDLDTEAEIIAALNATNGAINDILAALLAFGMMESGE